MSDVNPGSNLFKLDDLSLQQKAAGYPEEMREPFMWFGAFVREDCLRDLDILMGRCKELGVEHDKTTFSKILRGRWNRDADDVELKVPILALPKFLRVVEKLRDDQRVREVGGGLPFVETSTTRAIWNYIDVRRSPERVNRFGVVVGYTGTQKTAAFKEYRRRHNHGLCTWQEAPENGSLKEFVVTLSAKYGGGYSDSYPACRQRIFRTVGNRNTIIVDNAQTLYRPQKETDQPVLNLLRRLGDERECTVILSITPEFHRKIEGQMMQGYFEQFEGRAGGRRNFLKLPEYPPAEDVLEFAKAFRLRDAEEHVDELVKIAKEPGRVRNLLECLQTGKMIADGKVMTMGHVREARE